jgi:Rrf2 family transcriptional regulator, cysteine metabolism repressor
VVHLSTRSEYAIKVLVRLALADGQRPVQSRDIASFTGVPPKFLEQVMHDLRQAGLVASQRGKGGGYVLAADPANLTFAGVIDLIDGSHGGAGRMPGRDQAEALVAPVWSAVRQAVRTVLETNTIADAAARAAGPMYFI